MSQLQPKTPYFDLYELIARYPRITAQLTIAGYNLTEAGAALRDYRAGSQTSGEAINYTGGTQRAISTAYRLRHLIPTNPDGWTARQIARYQAEHRITKAAATARDAQRAADEAAAQRAPEAAADARNRDHDAAIERFYQANPDARPRSTRA